jgi:transglutaminase-like putative cysteine protease
MTNALPDTIRRLYTDPAEYIDSDHPAVERFAKLVVPGNASDRKKASLLYMAVRDSIRYNPYVNVRTPETFRASSVLAAANGYCVGKAALYAAACRVHGLAARVGFSDVRNHLTTQKLRQSMGTDIFTWHGFTEVFVNGAWRKATPTFNITLCEKLGVHPLDFDGLNDALLHPFDGAGRTYMQYLNDHGSYYDVPAKFLMREMTRYYANMQGEDLSDRDMEQEAAEG